jgi:hypothetical protein
MSTQTFDTRPQASASSQFARWLSAVFAVKAPSASPSWTDGARGL